MLLLLPWACLGMLMLLLLLLKLPPLLRIRKLSQHLLLRNLIIIAMNIMVIIMNIIPMVSIEIQESCVETQI